MTAFLRSRRGATAIEYALVASLISIVIVSALSTIGNQVKAMFAAITF